MDTTENTAQDALRDLEAAAISPDLAREILPRVCALAAVLAARVGSATAARPEPDDDVLLTAKQAAEALAMSPDFVYRNWRLLGGRKLGGATRFSRAGLNDYAANTRNNDADTQRDRTDRAGISVHRRIAMAHKG